MFPDGLIFWFVPRATWSGLTTSVCACLLGLRVVMERSQRLRVRKAISTMNKALWSKKALALPACAAILVGGLTLTASPANADPADLSVTSQSVSGRVLTVMGTGTPGENIQLDEDFRNTRHAIASDGKWTITYTIPALTRRRRRTRSSSSTA